MIIVGLQTPAWVEAMAPQNTLSLCFSFSAQKIIFLCQNVAPMNRVLVTVIPDSATACELGS